MGEIVEGLGEAERGRIVALRRAARFFWADVSLGETSPDALAKALDIPGHALKPLVDLGGDTPPSRKFHTDGQHVVFSLSCFTERVRRVGAGSYRLHPMEVHVLVCGDYLLTVHEERVLAPHGAAP